MVEKILDNIDAAIRSGTQKAIAKMPEELNDDLLLKISLIMVNNPKATVDSKEIGKHSKECYDCKFVRTVPGNAHLKCVKPDAEMSGDLHGIQNGWFMYPLLFDPTWKTKKCSNYQSASVNRAVNQETQVG